MRASMPRGEAPLGSESAANRRMDKDWRRANAKIFFIQSGDSREKGESGKGEMRWSEWKNGGRNPKFEIRKKSEGRRPKSEIVFTRGCTLTPSWRGQHGRGTRDF